MFTILVIFNLFEIIFNIISLRDKRKKEELYDSSSKRFLIEFVSIINLSVILILSTITTTKLKIKTIIFY